MAIIINEMEKPISCWKCPFLTEEEWLCLVSKRHVYNIEQPLPAWCPIMEQPSEITYLEQMMDEVERSHADEEVAHSVADGILCDLLTELGYERLVKAFDDVWKWYS